MKTENLSTLKIHKLSQEQYDRELAAGRIDENAIYLTPDDGVDVDNIIKEVQQATSNYSYGLDFTLNDDGESYSVTGIGSCIDTELIFPEEYYGLPVTRIESYAFEYKSDLKSITLSKNITSIGEYAFRGCSGLLGTDVIIPKTVARVGSRIFYECSDYGPIIYCEHASKPSSWPWDWNAVFCDDFYGQYEDRYTQVTWNVPLTFTSANKTYASKRDVTSSVRELHSKLLYGPKPQLPEVENNGNIGDDRTFKVIIRIRDYYCNDSGTGGIPYYRYEERTISRNPETNYYDEYSEVFTTYDYPGGTEEIFTHYVSIYFDNSSGTWITENDSPDIISFALDEVLVEGTGNILTTTSDKFSVTQIWDSTQKKSVPAIKIGNTVLTESKLNKIITFIDNLENADGTLILAKTESK